MSNLNATIAKKRVTTLSEEQEKVGLDDLDSLPLQMSPLDTTRDTMPVLLQQVNALVHEGDAAIQRLLAREVVLSRAALRARQAVFEFEWERYCRDKTNRDRVEFAERLVSAQHKRMLDAVTAFTRLDGRVSPRVRIVANRAQVAIAGSV